MDLSRLSDQDLSALSKGDIRSVSDDGLQHLAGAMPQSAGSARLDKITDKANNFSLQNKSASNAEATLQGAGQAALLGYAPELAAGAGSILPNPTAGVDKELSSQGFIVRPKNPDEGGGISLEDARKRNLSLQQEHPAAYGAGELMGGIGSAPLYGSALKSVPVIGSALGGDIAAGSVGEGIKQGAIAGAKGGAALGFLANPNQRPEDSGFNASGRLRNAAGGLVTGGVFGGAAGGIIGKSGEITTQPEIKNPEAMGGAPSGTEPIAAPTNASEIRSQVQKFKNVGGETSQPTAQMLTDIVDRNPDLVKPLPNFHDKMLSSKADYEELRNLAESPTAAGKDIRDYEQVMKTSTQNKLSDFVTQKAGRPALDKMEAGDQLMNAVLDKYNQNKEGLAPIFERFQNLSLPKEEVAPAVRKAIVGDIPKLNKYLSIDEDSGNLTLKPFTPKMGISPQSHGVMKNVVDALNSKSVSFEDLQNIREYMRQSLDPVNPKATKVVEDARKSLLNYMDTLVSTKSAAAGPSQAGAPDVRGTFKQYAQNEKSLDQVERIIGGKLENFDQLLTARPEKVLDRIFSSPTNIKIVRQVIGDEKAASLSADYLNNLMERSSKKGILSSQGLSALINKNKYSLQEAMGKDDFQRVSDLVDYMRLVPDAASPNPSGTARSTEIIKSILSGHPIEAARHGVEVLKEVGKDLGSTQKLNQIMNPPTVRQGNIYKAAGLLDQQRR
jgi:hypothetical protein